jgi:hypothetical protein
LAVSTTSSLFEQPAVSTTVNRKVAGEAVTFTVAGKLVQLLHVVGLTVAVPPTTLQVMEAMELSPGCAAPVTLNVVVPLGSAQVV